MGHRPIRALAPAYTQVSTVTDPRRFPGNRVKVVYEASSTVDGVGGLCWLSTRGFNLPERPNQTECDDRYATLEGAREACEVEAWCGGVMRDNGVRCSAKADARRSGRALAAMGIKGGKGKSSGKPSRLLRFQLRRHKAAPRYGFRVRPPRAFSCSPTAGTPLTHRNP